MVNFLGLNTDGTALKSLKLNVHSKPGLEIWRLLAHAGDPKTPSLGLSDIGAVLKTERC